MGWCIHVVYIHGGWGDLSVLSPHHRKGICGLVHAYGDCPGSSAGKESACSAEDPSSIPGSGRPPGGGHGNPLQDSSLDDPVDRRAWRAADHGVAKHWT